MITWFLATAFADEPTCPQLEPPPSVLSVAWIAPVGKHVGRKTWLRVVPTVALRQWVGRERGATVGRLLHEVGIRKRKSEPRRRYMITIFDVQAADVCRPVESAEPGEDVNGLPACPTSAVRSIPNHDGCGYTVDRATGDRGLDLYAIRWEDAAPRGFCVLPVDRFVVEGAR